MSIIRNNKERRSQQIIYFLLRKSDMIYIFYFGLCIVIISGYLAGIIYSLNALNNGEPIFKLPIFQKKEFIIKDQEIENEEETITGNSLSSRFTDNGDSFVDMECEVADTKKEDYINKARIRQNDSYNYIGKKMR